MTESEPRWKGGNAGEAAILRKCYDLALLSAVQNGCDSVAFPLLATGSYGFPKELGMQIAVDAFAEFLENHEATIWR